MTTVKEEVAVMKTEINQLKEQLITHISEQREDFSKLFEKLDSLDGKFAPKVTLYIATGAFLTALGIIITLII